MNRLSASVSAVVTARCRRRRRRAPPRRPLRWSPRVLVSDRTDASTRAASRSLAPGSRTTARREPLSRSTRSVAPGCATRAHTHTRAHPIQSATSAALHTPQSTHDNDDTPTAPHMSSTIALMPFNSSTTFSSLSDLRRTNKSTTPCWLLVYVQTRQTPYVDIQLRRAGRGTSTRSTRCRVHAIRTPTLWKHRGQRFIAVRE